MTISGERTKQLDIFCRITGFTSDFLSFIDVELIRFFHGAIQMLKTYQFKTHCKGNGHSSKAASVILPWLVIKHRWMPLRVQAKSYSSSSVKMLVEATRLTEFEYYIPDLSIL